MKGHNNLTARIALHIEKPDIEVAVWGQNLANVKFYDAPFVGLYEAAGIATASLNPPRTFGGTVTFNF